MQALLVLYMVSELSYSDTDSYTIFAAYLTLVYITPIFGGMIADRYIGCRRAIILGGVIMAMGHFSLAFPGSVAFYMGLALLVCGNGFFKANISSLLGKLYEHGDPRRDSGFTIFYMGINIGAFFSPLVCGYLGHQYGWHYGFGLAGIGMLIGLLVFISFMHLLENHGCAPKERKLKKRKYGLTVPGRIYLGSAIVIPLVALLVSNASCLDTVMPVFGAILLISMIYFAYNSGRLERSNVITIFVLMFFHACFWAFMDQSAMSINLFTDRNVDRMIGAFEVPTPWFQALNPVFIVTMAPVFSFLWIRLGRRHLDPYPPVKFAIALLLLAAGFGVLVFGTNFADTNGITPVYWLLLAYFLQTSGEVCISPVGLSMVTKLAPQRFSSLFMGIWLVSISYADYLGGVVAKFSAVSADENGLINPVDSLHQYGELFTSIAYISLGSAILLLLISPIMRKVFDEEEHAVDLIEGEEDDDDEDDEEAIASETVENEAC